MVEVMLYGMWGCHLTHAVKMALKLKFVEYQYVEVEVSQGSPTPTQQFVTEHSPVLKAVPLLFHKGKAIVELSVILDYINETWKVYPLLPQDPYERSRARFWAKFVTDMCTPMALMACRSKQQMPMQQARNFLETLQNELHGKRFFGGDSMGLVDIVANFIAYWLGVLQSVQGMDLLADGKFLVLRNWINDFVNDSKETLPPRDKLFHFFRAEFQSCNAVMNNGLPFNSNTFY